MTQSTLEDPSSLLTRLSQKPGVQSTLVLSRDTGAIVRTSGFISSDASVSAQSTLPELQRNVSEPFTTVRSQGGIHSAEDVARLVWAFMGAAGTMVEGLGAEDEVRLLRLRTKKNELVIVPDAKFLLVVIHETPPA